MEGIECVVNGLTEETIVHLNEWQVLGSLSLRRRWLPQLIRGQCQQIGHSMAIYQIIIHANLRTTFPVREVDVLDLCAALSEKSTEPHQSLKDSCLYHDVRVEGQINEPTVEGDVLPIRQDSSPAMLILPPPIPHT